ncbi:MAG TPA: prolyl oligopeptidase family serine peptidase [Thermoanaerobaculia bacterium]|nr:prolyl oligopeptidase family serine peptidase [Thermoanaerobaculia bacterium]
MRRAALLCGFALFVCAPFGAQTVGAPSAAVPAPPPASPPPKPPASPPKPPTGRPAATPRPEPRTETSPAAPSPSWTAGDLATAEEAFDWAVAPDGSSAAWVQSEVAETGSGEQRQAHVWLARLPGGSGVRMTRGDEEAERPRYAPDGRRLAYLSDRAPDGGEAGSAQIWILPLAGGEAYPATRFDREVIDFGWIDADTLVAVAKESPSAREQSLGGASDDAIVVDDAEHEPPIKLFRVELGEAGEEGTAKRLTGNRDWIETLAVSPDGKKAVATAERSLTYPYDQKVRPRTFLVDLATGAETDLLADGPSVVPQGIRWAGDGAGFYFTEERTTHPTYRMATVTDLWFYELSTRTPRRVDLSWDRGLAAPVEPLADGFLALLADGVRYRPARYTRNRNGWKRQDLAGAHAANLDAWTLGADGRTLLYLTSAATRPPQGYAAKLDGARIASERQVTDLNAAWEGKATGKSEVFRWKGAKGEMVEGILDYPLDWKAGEKRPLVLAIHGGPNETDRDSWSEDWSSPGILFRERGAFVLRANYHGSAGYGLEWVESIAGRYYELEIPDLEKGVDALIARGLVDPERLGTAGWSNGGILSAELITRSRRYKAASIGAADVEWISDWGNVDFGAAFDNYYFGGPPWERLEQYVQKSPFFRLKDVTTPTIAYTGTVDRSVPPHQSWSLFRALQQIGKAPTRLVLFPGEPHELGMVAHQRRKIQEDLDWFDRYLFGRPVEDRHAIPDGSALSGLLAKRTAARQGASLGLLYDGVLIPETAPHGQLEVARFEVTRAQFAAFDPSFEVPPEGENRPAIVPFERAKAYAAWLAKKAGQPFRLPAEDEARDLASEAGDGGNTLEAWVGYTPNPEDLAAIRAALRKALGGTGDAPLLEPAGSHSGLGEGTSALFDLDGNAAEWATGEGGKGVAIGPSADLPNDPKSVETPGPEYTGFRVVVGK